MRIHIFVFFYGGKYFSVISREQDIIKLFLEYWTFAGNGLQIKILVLKCNDKKNIYIYLNVKS